MNPFIPSQKVKGCNDRTQRDVKMIGYYTTDIDGQTFGVSDAGQTILGEYVADAGARAIVLTLLAAKMPVGLTYTMASTSARSLGESLIKLADLVEAKAASEASEAINRARRAGGAK